MEFRILGSLEISNAGELVDVGARKQRLLLALLVIHANRVVTTDRILEELWGDEAEGKERTLWVYISRLRSSLGEAEVLVTRDHGYSLVVDEGKLDARRFEAAAAEGRALIKDDPTAASERLTEGLELWRGPALEEFAYEEFAQSEILRLEELRVVALEDRADADLRRGQAGEIVTDLEVLHKTYPTRERVVTQLMVALYRAGRQPDALRAFERFRVHLGEIGLEPSPELRLLEEQILLHDSRIQARRPVGSAQSSTLSSGVANPFKGLRAFYEDDTDGFFGRDRVVADVVRRLDVGARLIGLVGPSGSGKSSIARAGVIPALRKGAIPGSDEWLVAQMVPGAHPFAELEAALLRSSLDTPDSLTDQLADPDTGVLRAVLRVLPSENARLVLVIDQFEELFTLVDDEPRREQFLSGLLHAIQDPHGRLTVIFTLRADFYERPLAYPEFGAQMGEGIINVVALTPDELEAAARRPAEEVGVALEPALLAALVADVVGRSGALPLFQYALTELFDRRAHDVLSLDDYQAIGGVQGALGRRGDDLFDSLDAEGQDVAKQLFLRLVTIADGHEWGRRRVPASEILSLETDVIALQAAIDAFTEHRLLTLDRDSVTGSPTVEVAHEALLTEWGRLHEWITGAQDDLKRRATLSVALDEWDDADRDPDYLFSGARLEAYESWAEASSMNLTLVEQAFIDTGTENRDSSIHEQLVKDDDAKRSARRRRWGLVAAVAAFAVAAVVLFLAARPSDPDRVAAFGPISGSSSVTELAATGYARAERELGVEVEFLDDKRFSDLEAEYRQLGEVGTEIVLIDQLHADRPWIEEVIAEYPETAFVVIDPFAGPVAGALNVTFAPEQAAFLSGAAAALATETGVIGYVGGLRYEATEAWRAGYEAGATTVDPNIEILSAYVSGGIEEGFETVGPGRAVALDLYQRGADVVLHVAGTASLGAIEAAREYSSATGTHVWAIAPDADWSLVIGDELQPHLLTSALKKFDVAVFDLIEQYTSGEYAPGEQILTLSSGSLGLAPTDHLTPEQLRTIDELTSQLIAGTVVAPTTPVGDLLPRLVPGVTEAAAGAEVDDIDIGDGFGPYAVGQERITMVDQTGAGRDLLMEIWFPIDDSAGLDLWRLFIPGDLVLESTHAFVATSDNISADGPFPLVIYSHGNGGFAAQDANFTEAIASHGYIVASVEHKGSNCCDPEDPGPIADFNRPHDVSAAIDAMLDANRSETAGFVDHVDAEQIAVTGHQGFTTYATVAGFENAVGEYVADERVGAIIGVAPFVSAFSDEQLASIDIPALVMIGTEDTGGASATRAWELPSSSPSYRVDLVGGEHLSFTDICDYVALLEANPDADAGGYRDQMYWFGSSGCEANDFPYKRAQAITNTFATTFLDSVFRSTEPIRLDQVDGQADLIYQVK